MSQFTSVLKTLLPSLALSEIDKLSDRLEGVAEDKKDPMKKTVLLFIADAMDKHGPKGINIAKDAIENIFAGKKPDISWASLRVASDILATLQNAEADKKTKTREFLVYAEEIIGVLVGGVLKGLL